MQGVAINKISCILEDVGANMTGNVAVEVKYGLDESGQGRPFVLKSGAGSLYHQDFQGKRI